jgi:predicted small secreted protein
MVAWLPGCRRTPSFHRKGRGIIHRTLTATACIQTEPLAVASQARRKEAIMQRKLAIILAVVALAGTAPLLSACYTTRGAGEDLQAAGHGLEHSAERNTNYRP